MTVLIIEDDDDIRQVLRLSLAHLARCRVVEASGGADGVLAAAQSRPDLIMLDVIMPVTDGPATLALLRQDPRTATIPVVFMTAKAMPDEILRLRQLGAAEVLTKPFDPTQLAGDVRALAVRLGIAD